MIKAVLFDLDGTLLPMDTDLFLEEYLKLVSGAMASYIPPEIFVSHLMEATYKMVNNKDREKTNEQVFREEFFAATGLDPDVMLPAFEKFYETDFCKLANVFSPDPIVPVLVKETVARFKTVVATNPVFPASAVKERLRWLGLDASDFALITSYEIMHYCKPHPEYYLEIASAIGIAPENCLMVGNDVDEDLSARQTGMKTFLVDTYLINRTGREYETDYRGSLADFLNFITGIDR